MARSVSLRCPACRREHRYVPPEYPCACGAPVTLPVTGDVQPVRVGHRSWGDIWTELDCPACGLRGQWPHPGFDCPCGALVRLAPRAPRVAGPSWHRAADGTGPAHEGAPGGQEDAAGAAGAAGGDARTGAGGSSAGVERTTGTGGAVGIDDTTGPDEATGADGTERPDGREDTADPSDAGREQRPPQRPNEPREGAGSNAARDFAQGRRAARGAPDGRAAGTPAAEAAGRRGPFRPLTIRTGYDAVACAAHFLRWLGFSGVRTAVPRTASGLDLRGPSVVGLVDASTQPTGDEELEVLWLHGLLGSSLAVAFSLAGYRRQARALADRLRLPLFVLDLSGTPQPVNEPGELLLRDGVNTEP
ncbi:hypothetical protein RM844_08525 [Streptomyces sp. DSM 44915]|uniref:Alpha/beta hydrolase n=1 Tax=Streptomyces chisholmiae TaxID=3075540 RepID=A0ABU2JMY3_9ACTN|nr:hypothetical protein [Streptomyces sp. DSM 44915]MDT0266339.1 hypothetical protein [Streptomyces sp. DSM 44915]